MNPSIPLTIILANATAEIPAKGTRLQGHKGKITSLAFTPNGQVLVSGSQQHLGIDTTLRLWDVERGMEIHRFERHFGGVKALVCVPDGQYLLTSSAIVAKGMWTSRPVYGNGINSWDLGSGRKMRDFAPDAHLVSCLAISPNSRHILVGSIATQTRSCLRIYDFKTGNEVRRLGTHPTGVNTVSFSPRGDHILCGSAEMTWKDPTKGAFEPQLIKADNSIRLWNASDSLEFGQFDYRATVNGLAYSPDGKWIVSAGPKETLLWDAQSNTPSRRYAVSSSAVVFFPSGRYFITGGGWQEEMLSPWQQCFVDFWDLATGKNICRLSGHQSKVTAIAVSPNSDFIASGSESGEIILWRAPRTR